MKKTTIATILMISSFSNAEAKLFSNINVAPEEFIACMGHSKDPRCKGHIATGCMTLCASPKSTLKKACETLCSPVKPVSYSPSDKNAVIREEKG